MSEPEDVNKIVKSCNKTDWKLVEFNLKAMEIKNEFASHLDDVPWELKLGRIHSEPENYELVNSILETIHDIIYPFNRSIRELAEEIGTGCESRDALLEYLQPTEINERQPWISRNKNLDNSMQQLRLFKSYLFTEGVVSESTFLLEIVGETVLPRLKQIFDMEMADASDDVLTMIPEKDRGTAKLANSPKEIAQNLTNLESRNIFNKIMDGLPNPYKQGLDVRTSRPNFITSQRKL